MNFFKNLYLLFKLKFCILIKFFLNFQVRSQNFYKDKYISKNKILKNHFIYTNKIKIT